MYFDYTLSEIFMIRIFHKLLYNLKCLYFVLPTNEWIVIVYYIVYITTQIDKMIRRFVQHIKVYIDLN